MIRTLIRAFLGDELARARLAAGFSSQQALADHLGFDRSVVGKAESGDRPPTPEVLRPWCEACSLHYDHFARLAALARRADGPVESWFVDWLEKELAAQMIRAWSPVLLPGLLQTGDYARALFMAAGAAWGLPVLAGGTLVPGVPLRRVRGDGGRDIRAVVRKSGAG